MNAGRVDRLAVEVAEVNAACRAESTARHRRGMALARIYRDFGAETCSSVMEAAADEHGVEYRTLSMERWVASVFLDGGWREELSWSHHRAVAADWIPQAERDRLLSEYVARSCGLGESDDWSVRAIEADVRSLRAALSGEDQGPFSPADPTAYGTLRDYAIRRVPEYFADWSQPAQDRVRTFLALVAQEFERGQAAKGVQHAEAGQ